MKSEYEKCGIHMYLSTLHFAKNLPSDIALIHCIFTHLLLQVTENNTLGQEEFKKNVEEILGFLDIKS